MFGAPKNDIKPNTAAFETEPLISANGFREYDARWLYEKEINLVGIQALGLALGNYFHERGVEPKVVVGHDYRSYSLSIKQALMLGLMSAGCAGARHRAGAFAGRLFRAVRAGRARAWRW